MDWFYNVALAAYNEYAKTTGNKNFRGEEMPRFGDLPDTIKNAWIAAVTRAVDYCVEHHYNGLDWGEGHRTPNNGMNSDQKPRGDNSEATR